MRWFSIALVACSAAPANPIANVVAPSTQVAKPRRWSAMQAPTGECILLSVSECDGADGCEPSARDLPCFAGLDEEQPWIITEDAHGHCIATAPCDVGAPGGPGCNEPVPRPMPCPQTWTEQHHPWGAIASGNGCQAIDDWICRGEHDCERPTTPIACFPGIQPDADWVIEPQPDHTCLASPKKAVATPLVVPCPHR